MKKNIELIFLIFFIGCFNVAFCDHKEDGIAVKENPDSIKKSIKSNPVVVVSLLSLAAVVTGISGMLIYSKCKSARGKNNNKNEFEDLLSDIELKDETIASLQLEVLQCREREEEAQKKIDELASESVKLHKEILSVEKKKNELISQIKLSKKQTSTANDKIKDLELKVNDLNAKKEEVESQMMQRASEFNQSRSQAAQTQEQINRLQNEVSRKQDVIDQLTSEKQALSQKASELEDQVPSCPICMESLNVDHIITDPFDGVESNKAKVTNCGHLFCSGCLMQSLRNSNDCPSCRATIRRQ